MKRPDGDNLEKYLNDSLNGIVWDDDARIAWVLRSKTITSDKKGYAVFYAQEISSKETNYEELLTAIQQQIYINKGDDDESNE